MNTQDMPTKKQWDITFFDIVAPFYNLLRHTWGSPQKSAERIASLTSFTKNTILLDLGGATGIVGQHFKDRVKKVILVDPSKKCLVQAQRYDITTKEGCAENIPLSNHSVDTIIIVDAFHHFHNHTQALRECFRVLKKGGNVIIEEFNQDLFVGRLMAWYEHFLQFKSKFFKPTELQYLAATIGFKTRLFDTTNFRYYAVLMS